LPISLPDKPRTAGEALHEIAAAVKSASGQAIDYGCCVGHHAAQQKGRVISHPPFVSLPRSDPVS